MRGRIYWLALAGALCLVSAGAFGGELNPGTGPGSTSGYTLNDIWNRLDTGADGLAFTSFSEPSTDPVGTLGIVKTLYEIMMAAPKKDELKGADPEDVLSGKTYWGLKEANWGTKTGTLPIVGKQAIIPGTSDQVIIKGYHDGTGTVAGDGDLTAGNILRGVQIFGVTGTLNGAIGEALAEQVLDGKSFSNTISSGILGTMPNNGAVTITPGKLAQVIAAGYHNGLGTVVGDANLITDNIKSGVSIFGVPGKTEVVDTTSATPAAAGDIRSGKTAFVNGSTVNGSLPTQTLSNTSTTVNAGYYDATTLNAVDSDLSTANIKSGVSIFGVSGKTQVVDTTSATPAAAGDIRSGKTAFVNGAAVSGSLPTKTLSSTSTTVAAGYYNATALNTVDGDLSTGNIKKGVTIFGVSGKTEVVDTTTASPAAAGDIRSGKMAFVNGATVSGSMPTKTLSSTSTTVAAGYYNVTALNTVDSDLSAGNIKSKVNVFGLVGTYPLAGVSKTGQTGCWNKDGTSISCTGTGQDGEYKKGIPWPITRFTNNGDGTVTDNLTGLIWLRDANCTDSFMPWEDALAWCNNLSSGQCSQNYSDWRLPNRNELASLFSPGKYDPALPGGHPFIGVSSYYWSSTTLANDMTNAWYMHSLVGEVYYAPKWYSYRAWPVRGGQ